MNTRTSTLALAAAFAIAIFGPAAAAHATFVTYTTVGTFDSGDATGTNVFLDAANNIAITFNGIVSNSVTIPPASTASFGTFDTSATSASTLVPVHSGFTLQIFETTPISGGPLTFAGSLNGSLAVDNSQAYIQFAAPLGQSIDTVLYNILSADSGTPGRLDLAPSTTNNGITTLQGQISEAAVPEPSSWALLGLGTCGALLFRRRLGTDVAAA